MKSGVLIRLLCVLCLPCWVIQPANANSFLDWFSSPSSAQIENTSAPVVWKFSHPAPPISLLPPILRKGLGQLTQQRQGQFRFKEFGGGVLHGQREAFHALRRDITDYAVCYASLEAKGFEYTKALTQYGVAAKNSLVTTRIFAELAPKYFSPEFEKKGVYYVASAASAPSRILTKKPVHSISDLKGLKLITHGISPETAKFYGYTPLNISFTETYTALQQGIADGVIGIDPAFIAFKLYEVANYLTLVDIAGNAIDICVNQKSFNRLSEENKAAFYHSQQPLMMTLAKEVISDIAHRASPIYKKHGVNLITPTSAEMEHWKAIGLASRAPWIARCKKRGKDCETLLTDIEHLKQKYERYSDDKLMDLAITSPVPGLISTYQP